MFLGPLQKLLFLLCFDSFCILMFGNVIFFELHLYCTNNQMKSLNPTKNNFCKTSTGESVVNRVNFLSFFDMVVCASGGGFINYQKTFYDSTNNQKKPASNQRGEKIIYPD